MTLNGGLWHEEENSELPGDCVTRTVTQEGDVIYGGAGNGWIFSGGGNDVLTGDGLHPSLDASLHGDDYLRVGKWVSEIVSPFVKWRLAA